MECTTRLTISTDAFNNILKHFAGSVSTHNHGGLPNRVAPVARRFYFRALLPYKRTHLRRRTSLRDTSCAFPSSGAVALGRRIGLYLARAWGVQYNLKH